MKGKYLITTDEWFLAPDGKQYKSAWGDVEVVGDELLGIKTNRQSTNWFAKVGSEDNHIIIAGCQIHYAIRCERKPNIDHVEDYNNAGTEGGISMYKRPTQIYIAN